MVRYVFCFRGKKQLGNKQWLDKATLAAPYWLLHFGGMTALLMSISKMLENGTAAADIKGEALANELANLKFEGLSGVSALMQTETDLRHTTY